MAYDAARAQIVLFGGSYQYSRNETWVFSSPVLSTGTISVTTNLPAASFKITGPASYEGGGQSFTRTNVPLGTYTIRYDSLNCFGTPLSETKILSAGQPLSFNGVYKGAATLSVGVSPASATSATFSINPAVPGMRGTGPYPVIQTNVWPQPYTVTFNALTGFTVPPRSRP